MKYIYNFKHRNAEGNKDMNDILGSKGANLAEMCNLGICTPCGFTLIPEASKFFVSNSFQSNEKFEFNLQFDKSLKRIESITKTSLASEKNPCLLSIRSGAKYSMPGMMDTILNLGLNDTIIDNLIKKTNAPYFIYDCYRRFIQTYGIVVLGIDVALFEEKLDNLEKFTIEELKNLCVEFKQIIRDQNKRLPANGHEQLREAIKAVYKSYSSDRAIKYRQENNLSEDLGTAVTVQAMVYGNKNENSLTGVIFSRDCLTGMNFITGEYLIKAQGDDLVGGIITPNPLSLYSSKDIAKKIGYSEKERLSKLLSYEEINPSLFRTISEISKMLEKHYQEVQDIEFTVEDGKLWILQTRAARKTNRANLVISKSLFIEGIISEEEFLKRTSHLKLEKVAQYNFKNSEEKQARLLGTGLAASSGLATGQIVFDSEEAIDRTDSILVREQTDTHDLEGILASKGVLTASGGTTSHAALICRGVNLCCIVGAKLNINYAAKEVLIGNRKFKEGDWISLDGDSGEIFEGKVPIH